MTVIDRRYSVAEGVAIKAPCRVATTANIALSGLQVIDGVTLAEHDRVLVWQQTDQRENGIYEASTGNWQRAKDFDGAFDVVEGTRVFVTQGTLYADTEFTVSTTGTITIGTSNIVFAEFVSASTALAQQAAAAAQAAQNAVGATVGTVIVETTDDIPATTIPASVDGIRTMGKSAIGDGAPAILKRVGSQPAQNFRVQSADGAWWQGVNTPVINALNYGLVGDDATDNAAAFAALNADIPVNGCTILIPPGKYRTSGPAFEIHNKFGVRVLGYGPPPLPSGLCPVEICYTGTSGYLIWLDAVESAEFGYIDFSYSDPLYGGRLIDLTAAVGNSPLTGDIHIHHFRMGCRTTTTMAQPGAVACLSARRTVKVYLDTGWVQNARIGIEGARDIGAGESLNQMMLHNIWHNTLLLTPIYAGGVNWIIDNCIFEPPWDTVDNARGIEISPWGVTGLTVLNSQFADAQGLGTWIVAFDGPIRGGAIIGSTFGGAGEAIYLGASDNVAVIGNIFDIGGTPGGDCINVATSTNLTALSNRMHASMNFLDGVPGGGSIVQNPTDGTVTFYGNIRVAGLPTSNPGISGRLWVDTANGNVVKMS